MISNNVTYKAKSLPIEPEWPEHVTKVANCPCKEAQPVSGIIYRRHDGTPTSNMSYKEQGKNVAKKRECQSTSLSCYLDKNHLRQIMNVHSDWAKHGIVQAELQPAHGVILQTGDTDPKHHSLWLRKKYLDNIESMFMVAQ